MNPYAKYLGPREPREVIAGTAARLESLFAGLGPERAAAAPAPGKWSAQQILFHLADTEIAFAFRLRQALSEDHHVIQPFDQEKWAERWGTHDLAGALATFSAVRAWNLALLRATPSEAYSKAVTHPERGELTFRVLVETIAGHDLNHLGQIEAIAAHPAGG